jgi:DNA primase catalytic subunit
MSFRDVYAYYSREDVQQALLKISRDREVVGVFRDGAFSRRPNTLNYAKDISMLVRNGAVAFHGSLERWSNPMSVGSDSYEEGRTGWDLILDMDCEDTEHGKVAVHVFMDALRKHGVKNACVKFTGGTGFHVGVPYESFPDTVDYEPTSAQYPKLARSIVGYLRECSRHALEKELLRRWTLEELVEQTGKKAGEIMTEEGIDPFRVVEVDPVLISPRHLFRLPYSLHEKSRLVSLPLRPGGLEDFKKEDASPEKVRFIRGFLDKSEPEEASLLVTEAADWAGSQKAYRERHVKRELSFRKPVPLQLAPPCIRNIMKGLSDGKKRSLLILINYLSCLGWKWPQITEELVKWNGRNSPQLRENYILGQIRWHERRGKPKPPPNCANPGYYESFGVCQPDAFCGGRKKSIKNPVNYAIKKLRKKN